jgi:triphosphoribosyl-dephospho-CoA synthetase
MLMTFDPTVNLGIIIHLVTVIVAISLAYGKLKAQMDEILRRLGCAEADVNEVGKENKTFHSRLASLERDVEWLKGEQLP